MRKPQNDARPVNLRGCFLSDLHLLSPRSDWLHRAVQWQQRIDRCDLIVLGGDIFDFRWAHYGDHQRTLIHVREWIGKLVQDQAPARVVYLLGNHDSHPDLKELLTQLAMENERFEWRELAFQIGDCLFCHGDLLDAKGTGESLAKYRAQFHHERPPGKLAHRAYDTIVAIRLHRAIPTLRHRPLATCQRLASLLWLVDGLEMRDVQRVFFGHTHVMITGMEVDGLTFFNPGASLRHLVFAPVFFEVACDV